jgi:type II secretory pathway pseudopilin PulG
MGKLLSWLQAHGELSGWAQAVGALIGLVIAIGIPAWQAWAARREDRTLRAQTLRATASVIQLAVHATDQSLEAIDQADSRFRPVKFFHENFADLCNIVDKIEVHQLPTEGCVAAVVSARQLLRQLQATVITASEEVGSKIVVSDFTRRRIGTLREQILTCVSEIRTEAAFMERGEKRLL